MIRPARTKFELSEKQQAISCGGIGLIMQVVEQLELRKHINSSAPVFQLDAPYDETDHVLNIAINLLAGALAGRSARRTTKTGATRGYLPDAMVSEVGSTPSIAIVRV